jgi:hypothetical protein
MSAEWDQTLAHRDFSRTDRTSQAPDLLEEFDDVPIHLVHVAFLSRRAVACVCKTMFSTFFKERRPIDYSSMVRF